MKERRKSSGGDEQSGDDRLIENMFGGGLPQRKTRFEFLEWLRSGYGIIERKYRIAALAAIFIGFLTFVVGVILSFSPADTLSLPFLVGGPSLMVVTGLGHLWHMYREGKNDVKFEDTLSDSILGASLFEKKKPHHVSVGQSLCAAIKHGCCPRFFGGRSLDEEQVEVGGVIKSLEL